MKSRGICWIPWAETDKTVTNMKNTNSRLALRELVMGVNTQVLLDSGECTIAVNFDNAATTPPLRSVVDEIVAFAPWYSSVHRGKGYKSILTSTLYEEARQTVKQFVQANSNDVVVFTKSTTESINLLAQVLAIDGGEQIVLATDMEHLANDLAWRRNFKVDYVGLDDCGRLSLLDFENKLKQHKGKIALVTVAGASNVSGYVNPVHAMARLAHQYGAKILVDGAQLVPHMPFCMNTAHLAEKIDFLAFSAHKLYAPFGTGVLIGDRSTLGQAEPLLWGGGAVGLTSHQFVEWDDPPARYEAGTPNVMGVVALVTAIKQLTSIGMSTLHEYENRLICLAIEGLSKIPGITLYCVHDQSDERVSLISFTLDGLQHELLAQALAQEAGIAVRNGLFCAHPYVESLLKLSKSDLEYFQAHEDVEIPGLVRISLGMYNTPQEVELFLSTMRHIADNPTKFARKYGGSLRSDRCCNRPQGDFC